MQGKELEKAMTALSAHLEQANSSLRTLSLLQMAQEFYTKEERDDFYARLDVLNEQADQARENARDHRPGDSRTWEQYVAQEKREVVAATQARIREAMDKAQEAGRKIMDYEAAHPVLAALVRHRRKLVSASS